MSEKQQDIIYHITFFGSGHLAENYSKEYKPFDGKEKHIYYKTQIKKGNCHKYFVFSGPNAVDLGELSIKNISKKAINILHENIKNDLEQIKKSNPPQSSNPTEPNNPAESNNDFNPKALRGKNLQIYRLNEFINNINNFLEIKKLLDPGFTKLVEQTLDRAKEYKLWLNNNSNLNATKSMSTNDKNANNKVNLSTTDLPKIKIKITGHSRGGTIAQKVYDNLKSYFKYDRDIVKFTTLNKADEYSGGFNRVFRKDYDKHTLDDNLDSIQVVSMAPTVPFNSIAYNRNAKATIFTTCSHGSCMAVAKAFRKLYKNAKGVYFHISDFYFQKGKDFKKQLSSLKKEEFLLISKNDLIPFLKHLCVKLLGKNNYLKKYNNLLKSKKKKLQGKENPEIEKLILMELIKKQISSRRYKIFEEELKPFL